MTLNEIKSQVILKGSNMKKLSKSIGLNRRTMYLHISKKNESTINLIKNFLSS